MIIDSHCHLKHGDAARTEYSAQAIVEMLDAVHIDKAVVFAMSTTTARSIEMAQAAVEEFPDRLIPYVYALPHYERPVLPEIDHAISDLGFRGIKIHGGECTLAEYAVDPVIKLAGERGVPCLIDCKGWVSPIRRLAEKFPDTTIICAHLGQYLCTNVALMDSFIQIAEECDNVVLDVSGVVTLWKIEDAVRRVGSERVVFGMDGPHKTPDVFAFARHELDKVNRLDLTDQQKQDVLGGTIARILDIDE